MVLGGLYCEHCFEQDIAPLASHCPKCGRRFLSHQEIADVQAESDKTDFDRAIDRVRAVEPRRLRLWLFGGILTALSLPAIFVGIGSVRRRNGRIKSDIASEATTVVPASVPPVPSPVFAPQPVILPAAPVQFQAPSQPPSQIVTCFRCQGTGKCKECNGSGKSTNPDWPTPDCFMCMGAGICQVCAGNGRVIVGPPCDKCSGTGSAGANNCWRCSGSGKVKGENEIDSLSSGVQTCWTCGGAGQIPSPCTYCWQMGRVYYPIN